MKNISSYLESSYLQLKDGFKAHSPLMVFSGLYLLAAFIFTNTRFIDFIYSGFVFLFLFACFLAMMFIVKAIALFFAMIFVHKPNKPLKFWGEGLKAYFFVKGRNAYSVPILLSFLILMVSFSAFKSKIMFDFPFYCDEMLRDWDIFLHFGELPSTLLHNFLQYPFWAVVLNNVYQLWFFLIFYSFFISGFAKNYSLISIRYVIASMILWLFAGNILATWFSSAGPCYFGFLGFAEDPYAPLMEQLRNINDNYKPLMALDVQNMLWEGYISGQEELAKGISAFPSLHVASSTLLACAGFAYRPLIGWILSLFAFLILVGSVYLGWHYAVDGYAGVVLAVLAWWAAKPVAIWYVNRKDYKLAV